MQTFNGVLFRFIPITNCLLIEGVYYTTCECVYLVTLAYSVLGRPTHMSADLCFTTDSSFFYLLFFSPSNLQARWTELNDNWPHGRKCNLKTHVRNRGYPCPYKLGPENHLFGRLPDLTANLTAYISWNEAWYRQSGKWVDNYKRTPTLYKNNMNFGPLTASNSTAILPTLCKFCFWRHCQASQMEICKRNSTTLPNGGR